MTITNDAGTVTYTVQKSMKAANDEDWDINKSNSWIWAQGTVSFNGNTPDFAQHSNKGTVTIELPTECGTAGSNAFVSAIEHAALVFMSIF